ncbi:pLS20_p028 family conjugation system transmembrane protein [Hominenteromicrobium sp.]|uniref:pLS20_p028 family conjugation system transmembrane protein n=1 Tax=Hominenteromicrobium sp. TaxID=3073581 RepID=UPI003AEF8D79
MSAQEILTRYGSYFEGQNLILTGLRELFYLVLSFLYSFIKGCGDLLSKAYNVLTFDTQSRVNEIFGGALSTEFLTAVVLIVVVCIGIAFILNSNSIKGSKIIQNIMFGLLVVFILPTFINSVNGIIASSDMGNISTSSVNKIFSANIVDLKYCFGGDTVIDPTGEVHNGFPDDYDYSLLPMDELIKGSETPGIDEVFTKTLLNRGSVDEELGECSSGEIFGNFISFLSSYYYRYKVDMFPIFLSEIATILVMVFTFFKVVRLCYELIVNHFFAYIFAITDIASGAKLREALKSILSTYVVLIYCSVAISLFNTFQAWIFDSSIFNNFEASICIIPVAMAVIDGPNLIERLFGIDAGIKSGFHTAMGLMHAGKTALGMGKAAWNLGKDVTGAKTPLDKARAVRQSELGNYGATHARGNDLETGGRGVADKKEKNGNANEMPHRRGEASTTGSVPNVKTERNPFNAESQNTQSDKEPLNEEKNSGQNSWSFAEPEEMHTEQSNAEPNREQESKDGSINREAFKNDVPDTLEQPDGKEEIGNKSDVGTHNEPNGSAKDQFAVPNAGNKNSRELQGNSGRNNKKASATSSDSAKIGFASQKPSMASPSVEHSVEQMPHRRNETRASAETSISSSGSAPSRVSQGKMQDIYSHSSNEPIVRNSNAGVEPSNTVQHPGNLPRNAKDNRTEGFAQREYKQEKGNGNKDSGKSTGKRRGEKL